MAGGTPEFHGDGSEGADLISATLLNEADQYQRVAPVERTSGPPAKRGRVLGRVRSCRAGGDAAGEREHSITLARMHLESRLDLDEAVRLIHRALSLGEDPGLRRELADWLASMGRHIEAGHLLRSGEPGGQVELREWLLAAGELYARGGDPKGASAAFGEAAMMESDDPRPLERLGALSYWAPDVVSAERASDAWIEASSRHGRLNTDALRFAVRAFERAPHHASAARAYAKLLHAHRRHEAADEVVRQHAMLADTVDSSGERRIDAALDHGASLLALAAACDVVTATTNGPSHNPIATLLAEPDARADLGPMWLGDDNLAQLLNRALRTTDSVARAESLLGMEPLASDGLRAMLLTFAAESYGEAGDWRRAAQVATRAMQHASWYPRPYQSLMQAADSVPLDATTLEKAIAAGPARGFVIRRLADRLAEAGELPLSLLWMARWLDTRPGDAATSEALLRRAIDSDAVELIEQAVTEVLAAPRPVEPLAASLSLALKIAVPFDEERAMALAKRVVATVGPGGGLLWEALRGLAGEADEDGFEVALLVHRAVSDEVSPDERAELFLQAAEQSLQGDDLQSAAEHLCRAAGHAADIDRIQQAADAIARRLSEVPQDQLSDTRLALAHADAWAAEQRDRSGAVDAWRQLGALRWDLADDPIGAEEAWFVSCAQDPETGPFRYAADLLDRAGVDEAIEMVCWRATQQAGEDDPRMRARLLTAAARLAADAKRPKQAVDLALTAVRTDPARAEAVALIESLASNDDDGLTALTEVYDTLGAHALGCYGYRAAHYRGARQLEQRGAFEHALHHAVAAFEAVPGAGASYRLLLRIAERAGNSEAAVLSVAGIADAYPDDGGITWLYRAAELAHRVDGGEQLRFDLLLRAFHSRPLAELVPELAHAAALLLDRGDEYVAEQLALTFDEVLPRLNGPPGGQTAVALASCAAEPLQSPILCSRMLHQAIAADRQGADFRPVLPHLHVLTIDRELTADLFEHIERVRADGSHTRAEGLVELTAQLAVALGISPPPSEHARASGSGGSDSPVPPNAIGTELDVEEDSFEGEIPSMPPSEEGLEPEEADEVVVPGSAPPESAPAPAPEAEAETGPDAAPAPGAEPQRPAAPEAASDEATQPSADTAAAIDFSPESERLARNRGAFTEVADMLAARIEATPNAEQRRLVRLRRAAVLEQRLERVGDACEELERVLEEVGADPTALRYLADLRERLDDQGEAAELWLRAAERTSDPEERQRDRVRAASALVRAGDAAKALDVLDDTSGLPTSPLLARLRLRAARALGDEQALEAAHAELQQLGVSGEPDDSDLRDLNTIPPAPAEDVEVEDVPQPSSVPPASGAPESINPVEAQLHSFQLEYRLRGAGSPAEARDMLDALRRLEGAMTLAQHDLRAFLIAEALDVIDGGGAAMSELEDWSERLGGTPLVTLAMAERLRRRGELRAALPLYERVLEADLQSMRSHGAIALDAADNAHQLGDDQTAEHYLERAALDDDTLAGANERRRAWFGDDDAATPESSLEDLQWQSSPPRDEQRDDDDPAQDDGDGLKRLAWGSTPPMSSPEARQAAAQLSEDAGLAGLEALDVAARSAVGFSEASAAVPTSLRTPPSLPEAMGPQEEDLLKELIDGSYAAGDYLLELYRKDRHPRTRDVLSVRRFQAALRRGDQLTLRSLRDAAVADGDGPYARAVSHVLAAFDPDSPSLEPPPLRELGSQPEATTSMLLEHLSGTVNEALGIVWGSGMMRRDPSDYGVSGTDRVPIGASTVVGGLYTELSRLVDLAGARLFHVERRGPLGTSVGLLSPLAAIVSGRADEDSALLRYRLGGGLIAATPQLALAEGLSANRLRDVLMAMRAGFGPVDDASVTNADQMRLAEDMWHLVPSAAEHRLHGLCTDAGQLTFEAAHANAGRARRRAGLFASGDLALAIEQTVDELDLAVQRPLEGAGVLRELCAFPDVADLYDLAILPQYAEARWRGSQTGDGEED
jgi:hypothetical protein